jgi:F0F1-type ATP synthase assembly protein I
MLSKDLAMEKNGLVRDLMAYSQIGLTLALSVILGFFLGWYLDHKVFAGTTAPWLSFIFLGFGIVSGFKQLWDLSKKIAKEDENGP